MSRERLDELARREPVGLWNAPAVQARVDAFEAAFTNSGLSVRRPSRSIWALRVAFPSARTLVMNVATNDSKPSARRRSCRTNSRVISILSPFCSSRT